MRTQGRLRRAAIAVSAGLVLQLFSLFPVHPLAFIVFVGLGVPVMAIGVVLYLLAIVGQTEEQP